MFVAAVVASLGAVAVVAGAFFLSGRRLASDGAAGQAPGAGDPARDRDLPLRLMLEQFPAICWTVDRDLRFTSSVGAGLAALGLRQGEVVGRTLFEYFGTTDRTMPAIAAHLRALEGAEVEYQFEWAGRSYQTRVDPFRAAGGTIEGAIGLANDVTDMKHAFEALGRTMERYQDLVQSLDAIVWEADPADLRFTFVSRQAETLLGHPVHRWLGAPDFWSGLIHPDDRGRAVDALRRAAADRRPRQFEYRARAADGRWLVLRHGVRVSGGERNPPSLRGLILDVTEQKTMENEALRAQKLDSVGLLAGGIAHDFNNLLHGIFGHIALARMEGDLNPAAREHLEQAEKALHRSQELTSRLLTFARGGAPMREVASIGELNRESVDFSLRGSKTHYEVEVVGDLWRAEVDPGQISQVLGNLALNADQAMPAGGTLRVRADNVLVEPGSPLPLAPGPYVRIRFADEGVGIAEGDLSRVFDPYYTTKETGTGLGLATAYSIVARHEGHIAAESEKGRGATFTIHLPAATSRPAAEMRDPAAPAHAGEPSAAGGAADATGAAAATAPARRPARILVLDDEPLIRDLLRELLLTLGYEVETAADGGATVRLYEQSVAEGRPFDLLILDLTTRGGLGGREALDQIRARHPAARAVVSSGYSHDPVMGRWADYGFKGVLAKPYTLEDLASLLTRVMGETA
jgi:PAS domain S-box-containing protein